MTSDDIAVRNSPQVEDPIKNVEILVVYHKKFSISMKQTVDEFWEIETSGGLGTTLLYFSTHAEDLGLNATDKQEIDRILSIVPTKLRSLDEAKKFNLGTPQERQEAESEIRRLYAISIEILTKFLKNRQQSRNSLDKNIESKSVKIQKPDDTINVILDYFKIMKVMSLIKFLGDRCVIESQFEGYNPSIINTVQMATGFCDMMTTDYRDLFSDILRLLPQEKWKEDRWKKVQEVDRKLSTQINLVVNCFKEISKKTNDIGPATENLLGSYRELCEITISEILWRQSQK